MCGKLTAMTCKTIAANLGKTGLCICPDFLSANALTRTANDLDVIRADGQFRRAGVGRGQTHDGAKSVRNDETYWLDRIHQTTAQQHLWRKIDLLKTAINRALFLGLNDFEGHYAAYPTQGHYQRHKDSLRGDSGRVVTFVLYLNRAWKSEDGGRLRIYATSTAGVDIHTDVDPIGGTLVCFMSGVSEHEVLLSHRPRFSLTGWFKSAGHGFIA